MSNKTQLQQNNLEYDSLIELLSGKSIGSNVSLQEKTISPTTSSQIVEPDDGYDGFSKVTVNAMPTATQATPSITVSSSGLITATSSQNAGYVTSGIKSATKQLTAQSAKTITPSTSSQTAIASGVYAIGAATVKGDANLVASNIKSGVSIFGVTGSYGGSGGQDMLQAMVDAVGCDYLFYHFSGTNIDFIANLDTSRATSMYNMFAHCSNLTSIPTLDTSQVTTMESIFHYCGNLTSIPVLNTSQVTNMRYMFYYCDNLTSIPVLNTSQVTNMNCMFTGCSSLRSIPALDTSQVTNLDMFGGCSNLESILMTGMKVNFNISASTKFTREALVTILNNLATVTSTKTLTMGSKNLAKLTDADKAIATNKG